MGALEDYWAKNYPGITYLTDIAPDPTPPAEDGDVTELAATVTELQDRVVALEEAPPSGGGTVLDAQGNPVVLAVTGAGEVVAIEPDVPTVAIHVNGTPPEGYTSTFPISAYEHPSGPLVWSGNANASGDRLLTSIPAGQVRFVVDGMPFGGGGGYWTSDPVVVTLADGQRSEVTLNAHT